MPRRKLNVNPNITQALLRQQIDMLRLEAGTRKEVMRLINDLLGELTGKLSQNDLTTFSKARVRELIGSSVDAINSMFGTIQDRVHDTLGGVVQVSARAAANTLDKTFVAVDFSAALPTETFMDRMLGNAMIMGAPSEEWWTRQSQDLAFRFANTVRQGLVAGDTTEQIVARVAGRRGQPGIMDVTRANARSLVHTSIQSVANEARFETFRQNDDIVEGIRQVSTLDSNTTDICMAYDGAEFDLEGDPINGTTLPYENGCPRHWGCRSVEVPITKTFKELGINAPEPKGGQRASEDGPVPASMTFEDFLSQHSREEQDEMLGAGRAEMWRDGTITLQQLLDQNGNPLTLEELKDKYE